MKIKVNLFLFSLILLFIACGCDGSSDEFEQVGYYKKKLINGSNDRVFSFFIKNFSDDATTWNKIEKFSKSQMYTSGGCTTVFFFNNRNYTPDVTFVAEQFDEKYDYYCVAAYWKYPSGIEKFSKYPFR
jgi:hypothetical protein